jgi:hypothetical protein
MRPSTCSSLLLVTFKASKLPAARTAASRDSRATGGKRRCRWHGSWGDWSRCGRGRASRESAGGQSQPSVGFGPGTTDCSGALVRSHYRAVRVRGRCRLRLGHVEGNSGKPRREGRSGKRCSGHRGRFEGDQPGHGKGAHPLRRGGPQLPLLSVRRDVGEHGSLVASEDGPRDRERYPEGTRMESVRGPELLQQYRTSRLARFHDWFYSQDQHPPERWPDTYDR